MKMISTKEAPIGRQIYFRVRNSDQSFRLAKINKIENYIVVLAIPSVSAFGGDAIEMYPEDEIQFAIL